MEFGRRASLIALMVVWASAGLLAQSPLQVLRISSGPSGSEIEGTYHFDEERARFDPSKDKQVVVFFQWGGAVGPHRIAVTWRSPDASLTTSSAIDYIARGPRFGAYFNLPLRSDLPGGVWSVEAMMDGQPAGRYTFELVSDVMREPAAPPKRPLDPAQMFSRLGGMFIVLDRQGASGQHLDPAAAFLAGAGSAATAVAAIDGSDAVAALMPDGTRKPVDLLQAFNRRQDWAIIRVDQAAPPVPVAGNVVVGDRCFSMEGSAASSRVAIDGAIVGRLDGGPAGPRWIARFENGTGVPGAPVLNEFGELIGVVGGTLVPGASGLDELMRYRAEIGGVPVIPASLVRVANDASPLSVSDLRVKGDLLGAVRGSENILAAGFTTSIIKNGLSTRPAEERQFFTAADKQLVAYVSWGPQARVKGQLVFRLVDEANHVVAESKPRKINIGTSTVGVISWEMPVPPAAGWYRGEFLLNGVPMYRRFVKVTN